MNAIFGSRRVFLVLRPNYVTSEKWFTEFNKAAFVSEKRACCRYVLSRSAHGHVSCIEARRPRLHNNKTWPFRPIAGGEKKTSGIVRLFRAANAEIYIENRKVAGCIWSRVVYYGGPRRLGHMIIFLSKAPKVDFQPRRERERECARGTMRDERYVNESVWKDKKLMCAVAKTHCWEVRGFRVFSGQLY